MGVYYYEPGPHAFIGRHFCGFCGLCEALHAPAPADEPAPAPLPAHDAERHDELTCATIAAHARRSPVRTLFAIFGRAARSRIRDVAAGEAA